MRALVVLILLLAVAVTPAPAGNEWYDHYDGALQALRDGDHDRAVALLETALAGKQRSGFLRTYGNNYIRYVPHFQLGRAYHGMGDCERALQSFERSTEAGETGPVPELDARLRAVRAECEQRLAPPPAVQPQIAEAAPETEPEPTIDRGELERGLRAYLAGDFDGSSETLATLAEASPQSARLRLLLGMSLHGAWVMGSEADEELIERARAELARAARLDPRLVPDPALCPPRVAALYRSLR